MTDNSSFAGTDVLVELRARLLTPVVREIYAVLVLARCRHRRRLSRPERKQTFQQRGGIRAQQRSGTGGQERLTPAQRVDGRAAEQLAQPGSASHRGQREQNRLRSATSGLWRSATVWKVS